MKRNLQTCALLGSDKRSMAWHLRARANWNLSVCGAVGVLVGLKYEVTCPACLEMLAKDRSV